MNSYQMAKSLSIKTRSLYYLPSIRFLLLRLKATAVNSIDKNTNIDHITNNTMSEYLIQQPRDSLPVNSVHKSPCAELLTGQNNTLLSTTILPLPSLSGIYNSYYCTQLAVPSTTTTTSSNSSATTIISNSNSSSSSNIDENTAKINNSMTTEHNIKHTLMIDKMELLIQESPSFLQKSFEKLFPYPDNMITVNLYSALYTVICISEHTTCDMSKWTQEMSIEREDLTLNFIKSATEITNMLSGEGFWADFIDPSSGRAYMSSYSGETLFETDDRMKHFGFEIEDLGCCKCIKHHLWGSNVFVGIIFTTAPIHSTVLTKLNNL